MGLKEFLQEPEFYHDREAMLVHHFIYESRLALARLGSRLQVLKGEVDHDGYDLVFDDGDLWKRLQLKTVFSDTASWSIHKRFLRPTPELADYFGIESSPEGIGLAGGVVLQELKLDEKDQLTSSYYYTDIFIIRALALGFIEPDTGCSRAVSESAWLRLQRGYDRISLNKGTFLKAKDATGLLGLAGFAVPGIGPWLYWIKILSIHSAGRELLLASNELLPASKEKTCEILREQLANIRATFDPPTSGIEVISLTSPTALGPGISSEAEQP
jgi:hypothetical protein